MLREDRPVDNHFRPDERLFLRVGISHLHGSRLLPVALPLPSFSVNRGKGSQPSDVLIPSCGAPPETSYAGKGIAAFPVSAVIHPKQIHPEAPNYSARVVHDPCDDNYFHAEVQLLDNNKFSPGRRRGKLAKLAKRHLRLRICDQSTVIVKPSGAP